MSRSKPLFLQFQPLIMRNYHFSTLLGLTATVALCAPRPVQAAVFNYDYNDNLKFISSRPIDSSNTLDFEGSPSENQGAVGFYNLDPAAPDHGHVEIGLNSRGTAPPPIPNNAPYYTSGAPESPLPSNGATRTSTFDGITTGFTTFNSYLKNNGIPVSNIGFEFGQKSGLDFKQTWNLGSDTRGVDWSANPNSPIEERIYRANPNNVQISLFDGTIRIINLGYSNLYSVEDYGATTEFKDDFESNFTDVVTAKKVPGLDSLDDGLADAFLQDVTASGGGVQVFSEQLGSSGVEFSSGNGYGALNISFPTELRAGPIAEVPEPSSVLGLLIVGAWGAVSSLKKQKIAR